jgi:putative FmdB family regulatory protein
MPIYEFTCHSCGLRFDKLFRRMESSDSLTETPCDSCGNSAYRQVTAAAFTFSHAASQVRGAAPPSTGTSDDWNYDKAIGRDAEQKWKIVEQRDAEKSRVIRQERENGLALDKGQLVRSREDGSYRAITEPERQVVNERRTTAFQVAQAAKAETKKPPSKK